VRLQRKEEGKGVQYVVSSIQTITITPFSRVFYLVDMLFPTKMEIVLHSQDYSDPATYLQEQVHPKLRPCFINRALNSGVYELVSTSNVAIPTYFYTFQTTTPANAANQDTLEISRLSDDRPAEVTELLPEAEEVLPEYVVPKKFCSYHEVQVRIMQVKVEAIGEVVDHVKSMFPAVADSILNHPSFFKYTSQPTEQPVVDRFWMPSRERLRRSN
jgi:hypothetical protein